MRWAIPHFLNLNVLEGQPEENDAMRNPNPRKQPPFKLNPQRIAYIRYQQYLLSMKRVIDSEARKLQKSPSLGMSIKTSSNACRLASEAARQGFNDTQAPVIPYLSNSSISNALAYLTESQRIMLEAILNSEEGSSGNCGIGPGGFQPGNTCAKGGGSGPSTSTEEIGHILPKGNQERSSPRESEEFRMHTRSIADKASSTEKSAVRSYTMGGYRGLNESLRESGGDTYGLDKDQQAMHDGLKSLIAKAGDFPKPMVLYRGVRLSYAEEEKLHSMAKSALESGKPITMYGFQSTSTATSIPYDFGDTVLEIAAKRGAPLGSITSQAGEGEVLLAGGKFKVVGIHRDVEFNSKRQTRHVIQLEQL